MSWFFDSPEVRTAIIMIFVALCTFGKDYLKEARERWRDRKLESIEEQTKPRKREDFLGENDAENKPQE